MTGQLFFVGSLSLFHPFSLFLGRPKADADYPPEVVSKTPEKATPQLAAQVAPQAPPAKQVTAKHVPAPSLGDSAIFRCPKKRWFLKKNWMLFPTGGNFRVGICLGCYGIYIYVYYIPNFWEGGEVGKRGKGVYDTWHMKYYEIVYSQLLGRAKYEGVYSGDSMSQLVQGTWRVDW